MRLLAKFPPVFRCHFDRIATFKSFQQEGFEPRLGLCFLCGANELANVFAGLAVTAALEMLFNEGPHIVRQRYVNGCHKWII